MSALKPKKKSRIPLYRKGSRKLLQGSKQGNWNREQKPLTTPNPQYLLPHSLKVF